MKKLILKRVTGNALKALIITVTAFLALNLNTNAAEISYPEKFEMLLSGEIRQGDAEKIASLFGASFTHTISVDSRGGDVGEALKIASLIKGMGLNVDVPSRGYCASACFFLYLAGDRRSASGAKENGTLPRERDVNWVGRDGQPLKPLGYVGIHRPYFKSPTNDLSSVRRQEEMMRKVKEYLALYNVPQRLIDEMMARPSNDSYWLAENDLDLIGTYSPGREEVLISNCGYKRSSAISRQNWSIERKNALTYCEARFWEMNILPMQNKFRERLRSNWRPWTE